MYKIYEAKISNRYHWLDLYVRSDSPESAVKAIEAYMLSSEVAEMEKEEIAITEMLTEDIPPDVLENHKYYFDGEVEPWRWDGDDNPDFEPNVVREGESGCNG